MCLLLFWFPLDTVVSCNTVHFSYCSTQIQAFHMSLLSETITMVPT